MTDLPARLGRRQVEVLRAASTGQLIRFDDGGWVNSSAAACTRPARRVAELGLLADGRRGAVLTVGVGTRPGTWMRLSSAGERALAEWELAHPQQVVAEIRGAEAIRALAAKPGEVTGVDLLALAARDEELGDDGFVAMRPAMDDGEQPGLCDFPWAQDGCDHD